MSIPLANESRDPILEEIHATRRRLLAEHGGLEGLVAFLREQEAKSSRQFSTPNEKLKSHEPVPPANQEIG
jgi:hypothetical protein